MTECVPQLSIIEMPSGHSASVLATLYDPPIIQHYKWRTV